MLQLVAILAITAGPPRASPPPLDVWAIDRARILKAANAALRQEPVTVTSASSPRSAGGLHDYFSEADYWWPDATNPGGEMDDQLRPEVFIHASDVGLVGEVVLAAGESAHLGAVRFEQAHHRAAEKAAAAGYGDALTLPEF